MGDDLLVIFLMGQSIKLIQELVLQFLKHSRRKRKVQTGNLLINIPNGLFMLKRIKWKYSFIVLLSGLTAYDDEIFQTVVLKEGSVFVKNNQGNGQTIQPNQCLMVEKEEMTVQDVDVYDYISWIDGVVQFHEKSLQKVLNSLSRYYRVRFDCPMEIGQIKCSGNLVLFDDIDQVFDTSIFFSFSHQDEVIKIEYVHK